jgi:hypothetical protein
LSEVHTHYDLIICLKVYFAARNMSTGIPGGLLADDFMRLEAHEGSSSCPAPCFLHAQEILAIGPCAKHLRIGGPGHFYLPPTEDAYLFTDRVRTPDLGRAPESGGGTGFRIRHPGLDLGPE